MMISRIHRATSLVDLVIVVYNFVQIMKGLSVQEIVLCKTVDGSLTVFLG